MMLRCIVEAVECIVELLLFRWQLGYLLSLKEVELRRYYHQYFHHHGSQYKLLRNHQI